eukprot:gene1143-672_t
MVLYAYHATLEESEFSLNLDINTTSPSATDQDIRMTLDEVSEPMLQHVKAAYAKRVGDGGLAEAELPCASCRTAPATRLVHHLLFFPQVDPPRVEDLPTPVCPSAACEALCNQRHWMELEEAHEMDLQSSSSAAPTPTGEAAAPGRGAETRGEPLWRLAAVLALPFGSLLQFRVPAPGLAAAPTVLRCPAKALHRLGQQTPLPNFGANLFLHTRLDPAPTCVYVCGERTSADTEGLRGAGQRPDSGAASKEFKRPKLKEKFLPSFVCSAGDTHRTRDASRTSPVPLCTPSSSSPPSRSISLVPLPVDPKPPLILPTCAAHIIAPPPPPLALSAIRVWGSRVAAVPPPPSPSPLWTLLRTVRAPVDRCFPRPPRVPQLLLTATSLARQQIRSCSAARCSHCQPCVVSVALPSTALHATRFLLTQQRLTTTSPKATGPLSRSSSAAAGVPVKRERAPHKKSKKKSSAKGTQNSRPSRTPCAPSRKPKEIKEAHPPEAMARSKGGYYAVARGHRAGVYSTWEACSQQVNGFPGAVYKKFATPGEAQAFVEKGVAQSKVGCSSNQIYALDRLERVVSSLSAPAPPASHVGSSGGPAPAAPAATPYRKRRREMTLADSSASDSDVCEIRERHRPSTAAPAAVKALMPAGRPSPRREGIYVDGACSCNGQGSAKARGGYGVYYGPSDPRNVALPLEPTELQTNNRAELKAVVHAISTALKGPQPLPQLHIHTDSKYVIDGMLCYGKSWVLRGFKLNGTSKPVLNQDLWKLLLDLRNQYNSTFYAQSVAPHEPKEFTVFSTKNDEAVEGVIMYHVKGHANNKGNVEADKLAVQGARIPHTHISLTVHRISIHSHLQFSNNTRDNTCRSNTLVVSCCLPSSHRTKLNSSCFAFPPLSPTPRLQLFNTSIDSIASQHTIQTTPAFSHRPPSSFRWRTNLPTRASSAGRPMWILYFEGQPAFWLVGDQGYRIGKHTDCDVQLREDKCISRLHLTITLGLGPLQTIQDRTQPQQHDPETEAPPQGPLAEADPERRPAVAPVTLIDTSTYGTTVAPVRIEWCPTAKPETRAAPPCAPSGTNATWGAAAPVRLSSIGVLPGLRHYDPPPWLAPQQSSAAVGPETGEDVELVEEDPLGPSPAKSASGVAALGERFTLQKGMLHALSLPALQDGGGAAARAPSTAFEIRLGHNGTTLHLVWVELLAVVEDIAAEKAFKLAHQLQRCGVRLVQPVRTCTALPRTVSPPTRSSSSTQDCRPTQEDGGDAVIIDPIRSVGGARPEEGLAVPLPPHYEYDIIDYAHFYVTDGLPPSPAALRLVCRGLHEASRTAAAGWKEEGEVLVVSPEYISRLAEERHPPPRGGGCAAMPLPHRFPPAAAHDFWLTVLLSLPDGPTQARLRRLAEAEAVQRCTTACRRSNGRDDTVDDVAEAERGDPSEALSLPPSAVLRALAGGGPRCRLLADHVFLVAQPALWEEVQAYIPAAGGRAALCPPPPRAAGAGAGLAAWCASLVARHVLPPGQPTATPPACVVLLYNRDGAAYGSSLRSQAAADRSPSSAPGPDPMCPSDLSREQHDWATPDVAAGLAAALHRVTSVAGPPVAGLARSTAGEEQPVGVLVAEYGQLLQSLLCAVPLHRVLRLSTAPLALEKEKEAEEDEEGTAAPTPPRRSTRATLFEPGSQEAAAWLDAVGAGEAGDGWIQSRRRGSERLDGTTTTTAATVPGAGRLAAYPCFSALFTTSPAATDRRIPVSKQFRKQRTAQSTATSGSPHTPAPVMAMAGVPQMGRTTHPGRAAGLLARWNEGGNEGSTAVPSDAADAFDLDLDTPPGLAPTTRHPLEAEEEEPIVSGDASFHTMMGDAFRDPNTEAVANVFDRAAAAAMTRQPTAAAPARANRPRERATTGGGGRGRRRCRTRDDGDGDERGADDGHHRRDVHQTDAPPIPIDFDLLAAAPGPTRSRRGGGGGGGTSACGPSGRPPEGRPGTDDVELLQELGVTVPPPQEAAAAAPPPPRRGGLFSIFDVHPRRTPFAFFFFVRPSANQKTASNIQRMLTHHHRKPDAHLKTGARPPVIQFGSALPPPPPLSHKSSIKPSDVKELVRSCSLVSIERTELCNSHRFEPSFHTSTQAT